MDEGYLLLLGWIIKSKFPAVILDVVLPLLDVAAARQRGSEAQLSPLIAPTTVTRHFLNRRLRKEGKTL